jgi:hypothetical protein
VEQAHLLRQIDSDYLAGVKNILTVVCITIVIKGKCVLVISWLKIDIAFVK